MRRALILATIICVFSVLNVAEARWTTTTRKSRTTTTTTPTTKATPTTIKTTTAAASNNADDDRTYHPAEVLSPRLIERFDKRSLDGHYEYRYVLSNGDTRYERAYWIPVGKKMVLARKGYYSYPMPNGKFLTVFYTADQNGFHEVSSTNTLQQPVLPRNLEVPEYAPPVVQYSTTTTSAQSQKGSKPKGTTKTLEKLQSKSEVDDTLMTTMVANHAEAGIAVGTVQPQPHSSHHNDNTAQLPTTQNAFDSAVPTTTTAGNRNPNLNPSMQYGIGMGLGLDANAVAGLGMTGYEAVAVGNDSFESVTSNAMVKAD